MGGGLGGVPFKRGAGLRLRTYPEGERQQVERRAWSVEFRSLEVRPAVRVCGWGLGPVGGGHRV